MCDGTLESTREFSKQNDLKFEVLKEALEVTGGVCDCRALVNSSTHISRSRSLPSESPDRATWDDWGDLLKMLERGEQR